MDESRRTQLDGIVQKMTSNGEKPETIQLVVNDFKSKYSTPTKTGDNVLTRSLPFRAANALTKPITKALIGGIDAVNTIAGNDPRYDPNSNNWVDRVKKFYDDRGDDMDINTFKEGAGTAIEAAANLYAGSGIPSKGAKITSAIFKGARPAAQSIGGVALEGAVTGAAGSIGDSLQKDDGAIEAALGAIGYGLVGGVTGGILSGGGNAARKALAPIAEKIDTNVRKIFEGVTADSRVVEKDMQKFKDGASLLQREWDNLDWPEGKKPSHNNATANEMITAVNLMDKKIVGNARKAVSAAAEGGLTVDTNEAMSFLQQQAAKGQSKSHRTAAQDILKDIEIAENSPVALFDYIQDINKTFDKRTKSIENEMAQKVADILRTQMDEIVDRSGYGATYGANQSMKKMIIAAAKKENKALARKLLDSDLTSDAGVDAAFAILLGSPAYLLRSGIGGVANWLQRRIVGTRDMDTIRKILKQSGKADGKPRLPGTEPKWKPPVAEPVKPEYDPYTPDSELPSIEMGGKYDRPTSDLPVVDDIDVAPDPKRNREYEPYYKRDDELPVINAGTRKKVTTPPTRAKKNSKK